MEHGRKWWFWLVLLIALAVILLTAFAVILILMGEDATQSPVLIGIFGVIGVLAAAIKWYCRRKHP